MNIRTKIICTLGPSVSSQEKIEALIHAGMNVARLNFSHGTHEEHLQMIQKVKAAREKLQVPIAIMLDTKGPEIRLGQMRDGQVELEAGQEWLLVKEDVIGDESKVTITPAQIFDYITPGICILFDNGFLSSIVQEITPEGVVVRLENGGLIKSRKGVNIPNVVSNLPAMTEKDIDDIRFGCENDIDLIAASFVRSPDHVVAIKRLLEIEKQPQILIIAKIENAEGIQNFDAIVQVADGIMIARGDLGVEVPVSQVPRFQKMMIRKSYLAGKPVVTATQMLESMMTQPRPTRADVSDVANAIYDSTSAVMLSGETAVGAYPIETVKVMRSIIKEAESDFVYRSFFDQHTSIVYQDVASALTLAAVKTAYSSGAEAIFAFTQGGSTSRLISRLRPAMPIIAMTPYIKSYHQMSLNWGILPFYCPEATTYLEAFEKISTFALDHKVVNYGGLVVVTAGNPFGVSGTTNMMVVESIGDVLIRGIRGWGERVHGKVKLALSPDEVRPYEATGKILVIPSFTAAYEPLVEESLGVVLQNHVDDIDSENHLLDFAHEHKIPVIIRGDGALRILKEGGLVTLAPEQALVYKGVILHLADEEVEVNGLF